MCVSVNVWRNKQQMLPVVISVIYSRILALFPVIFFFLVLWKEGSVVASRSNMNGFFGSDVRREVMF